MRPFKSLKRQAGVGLIELSIVAALSLIALTLGVIKYANMQLDDKARLEGALLQKINEGVGSYIGTYYTQLRAGSGIPGVANIYAPTMTELSALNMFGGVAIQNNDLYGNTIVIDAWVTPTGCVPAACQVQSRVRTSGPIVNTANGKVDYARAAIVQRAAGGDAGVSSSTTPGQISGPGGTWFIANPSGLGGVVGLRGGVGSLAWNQYIRADGSVAQTSQQTGNWQVQGSMAAGGAITTPSTMTAGGAITTSSTLTAGGQISTNSTMFANGTISTNDEINAMGSISTQSDIYSANGIYGYDIQSSNDVFAQGNVNANGVVTGGLLRPATVATANTACWWYSQGTMAQDANGRVLTCQAGVWKSGIQSGTGTRGVMMPQAGQSISCSSRIMAATGAPYYINADVWVWIQVQIAADGTPNIHISQYSWLVSGSYVSQYGWQTGTSATDTISSAYSYTDGDGTSYWENMNVAVTLTPVGFTATAWITSTGGAGGPPPFPPCSASFPL